MRFGSRLTVASSLAVALAAILMSTLVFVLMRSELHAEIDDSLVRSAEKVFYFQPPNNPDESQTFRPGRRARIEVGSATLDVPAPYVQVIYENEQGDVRVFDRHRGQPAMPIDDPAANIARSGGEKIYGETEVGGTHLRILTEPLSDGYALQIGRSLEEVDNALRNLALILGAVSAAAVALAMGLGRVIARAVLAPVRRLTEETEAVADTTDLSRRIAVRGSDEVAVLGARFNAMLAALENSMQTQRRLVADASHELRTPITSVRANIEFLANNDELPRAERKRVLGETVEQLEELTALLGDVLELARGNEPDPVIEDVRLDLLVEQVVDGARRRWPSVEFSTNVQPSLVRGSPARIERAIVNLIGNAVKWGPPNGPVEVSVADGEVAVRDHGSGFAESDIPHVFARFYRAPSARGTPGSGLGLAIVRQVAESHGGAASAENAEDGGALVRLKLQPVG